MKKLNNGEAKSVVDVNVTDFRKLELQDIEKNTVEGESSYSNLLRKSRMESALFFRMENMLRDMDSDPSSPTLSPNAETSQPSLPPLILQSLESLAEIKTEKAAGSIDRTESCSNSQTGLVRTSSRAGSKVPPPIITTFQQKGGRQFRANVDEGSSTAKNDSLTVKNTAERERMDPITTSAGLCSDCGAQSSLLSGNTSVNFFKMPSPEQTGIASKTSDVSPVKYSGPDVDGTLPLIPTSPLLIQISHVSSKVEALRAQLSASTSNDSERCNAKLAKYEASLSKANREKERYLPTRPVNTVDPMELAKVIAGFHWDMLMLVKVDEDFGEYSRNYKSCLAMGVSPPALPRSLQSIVDFGVFLVRVVVMTIVTPYRDDNRQKVVDTWIKVAHYLRQKFNDQQGTSVIAEALMSVDVQCFSTVWSQLRPEYKLCLETIIKVKNANDEASQECLAATLDLQPMKPVILNLRRLVKVVQLLPWDGKLRDSLRMMASYRKAYATFFESREMKIAHWLVLQKWLDQQQTKSYTQQYIKRTKQSAGRLTEDDAESSVQELYALYATSDNGNDSVLPQIEHNKDEEIAQKKETLIKQDFEKLSEGKVWELPSTNSSEPECYTVKSAESLCTTVAAKQSPFYIRERSGSLDNAMEGFSKQSRAAGHNNPRCLEKLHSSRLQTHNDAKFLKRAHQNRNAHRNVGMLERTPRSPQALTQSDSVGKERNFGKKIVKLVFMR